MNPPSIEEHYGRAELGEVILAALRRAGKDTDAPLPLGLHLILGPDWPEMAGNVVRNLEQSRIALVQGVLERVDRVAPRR